MDGWMDGRIDRFIKGRQAGSPKETTAYYSLLGVPFYISYLVQSDPLSVRWS